VICRRASAAALRRINPKPLRGVKATVGERPIAGTLPPLWKKAEGLKSLCGKSSLPTLPDLPITETIEEVIVYHADRLHVGIHDRRTNETESATLKVLAECVGFERSRRNLSHDLPSVKLWLSVDEAPAKRVEASELFLDFEKGPRVAHGGLDLHAVANDLRI
jgi:hypothetical protein